MGSIRDDEAIVNGYCGGGSLVLDFDEHLLNRRKVAEQEKKEVTDDEERKEVQSIEMIFKDKEVPSWQKQLTFRAFFVSFVLGILFSVIVMKLNLTSGIIPSLNVSAGLLGFFFVKTWTKFLEKSGLLQQPFTRQENTVIQTCVVASSGIAFSGGFGSYLFGMSEVISKQASEANDVQDFKNPSLGWIIVFLFLVSFLGQFLVLPLRKNCVKFALAFFIAAVLLNFLTELLKNYETRYKIYRFIPSPMCMAIPFYLGAYFVIDMCVGSLILFVWELINKNKARDFAPALASGLICGESLWGIPAAVLALANVKPPICMKFLSASANKKVDGFLGN